jgi:hypothetical protein
MCQKRQGTNGWRAVTVSALVGFAVSACGSDGPTRPKPTSLSDLFGTELYRADGTTVGVAALNNVPLIGIYFANPGCPACGGFTPNLVDAYDQLEAEGKSFEVVLVSAGISDATLFDYMVDSEMGWLAIPPQSGKANTIAQRYNVRWVPTLIVIDDELRTITYTGREEVAQVGADIYEVWLTASGGS